MLGILQAGFDIINREVRIGGKQVVKIRVIGQVCHNQFNRDTCPVFD
jgi:hypothetical protein